MSLIYDKVNEVRELSYSVLREELEIDGKQFSFDFAQFVTDKNIHNRITWTLGNPYIDSDYMGQARTEEVVFSVQRRLQANRDNDMRIFLDVYERFIRLLEHQFFTIIRVDAVRVVEENNVVERSITARFDTG